MQLTRPRACTTSSFTLAVAVAVKANTGVFGNFCFKIPRPWTFNKIACRKTANNLWHKMEQDFKVQTKTWQSGLKSCPH